MKSIKILFWICVTFVLSGCILDNNQSDEISATKARELIQRNIFFGENIFPIEGPKAYQYGNVHVDGPSGGMLYRFSSTLDALKWIVEQHNLQKFSISNDEQLPMQMLEETPNWWNIEEIGTTESYAYFEELPTGGKRQLLVLFDPATNIIYVVEHFSAMPGV